MALSKVLALAVALILSVSGCSSATDVTQIAKSLPEVNKFLADHPGAEIKAVLWPEAAVQESIDAIRTDCGGPVPVKSYFRVAVSEGATQLVLWLDPATNQPACVIKTGSGASLSGVGNETSTSQKNESKENGTERQHPGDEIKGPSSNESNLTPGTGSTGAGGLFWISNGNTRAVTTGGRTYVLTLDAVLRAPNRAVLSVDGHQRTVPGNAAAWLGGLLVRVVDFREGTDAEPAWSVEVSVSADVPVETGTIPGGPVDLYKGDDAQEFAFGSGISHPIRLDTLPSSTTARVIIDGMPIDLTTGACTSPRTFGGVGVWLQSISAVSARLSFGQCPGSVPDSGGQGTQSPTNTTNTTS